MDKVGLEIQENKIIKVVTTTVSAPVDDLSLKREIAEYTGLIAQKREELTRLKMHLSTLIGLETTYDELKELIEPEED